MKMFAAFVTVIFSVIFGSSVVFAEANFDKIKATGTPKNILSEGQTTVISAEESLQPIHMRSTDMMRLMLGAPVNSKGVGPAAQAEWLTRLSAQSPLYAAAGIGYVVETKPNSEGNTRNFHQLPIYLNLGYTARLVKGWKAALAAGPVLRQTFERGNTIEQNRTYAYGDLIASVGVDYEWIKPLTNSGQSVGIRASRMFGLADAAVATPVDTVLLGFAFDL
jgi:hypothetical protein